jgi:hypothetical protein
MAKRETGLKKTKIQKRGPTRTAKKKEMLRIKALKPAARKLALNGK